tara:strand:- start:125 stop:820 length:696 start_codon:yes stop_codon:yes gene_type:complete
MMDRVLILAAHPDDDILGCGGTIAKCVDENISVKVVFIAEGTSCRYDKCRINDDDVHKEILAREECALKALGELGVSRDHVSFHNLPCGRLDQIPVIDIGKIIEKEINSFKPDTIFTHSKTDVNVDHQCVFQATLQATRPGAKNNVSVVLCYEVLSSTEWRFEEPFQPNFFILLDEGMISSKVRAFEHYLTEKKPFPFPRSREGLVVKARQRGMQVGTTHAEAFYLLRGIM